MFVASSRRDSASCSKITRKAPTTLFVTLPLSPAFQVKMETRLILQPVACLFVYPSERPHISCLQLGCKWFSAFAGPPHWHRASCVSSRVGRKWSPHKPLLLLLSCARLSGRQPRVPLCEDQFGGSLPFVVFRLVVLPFPLPRRRPLSFPLGSFPRPSGHEQRTTKENISQRRTHLQKKDTSPERIPQVWRQSFTRAHTRNQFCNERNSASTGAKPLN